MSNFAHAYKGWHNIVMVDVHDLPIYYETEKNESMHNFRSRAIRMTGYTSVFLSGVFGGDALVYLEHGENSSALAEGLAAVTEHIAGQIALYLARINRNDHS